MSATASGHVPLALTIRLRALPKAELSTLTDRFEQRAVADARR